jgi:hypothetical protein
MHPFVHPIFFVWTRIWDANTTPKTRLSKFKDLINNKVTVAQGKLLLEIIKNTH